MILIKITFTYFDIECFNHEIYHRIRPPGSVLLRPQQVASCHHRKPVPRSRQARSAHKTQPPSVCPDGCAHVSAHDTLRDCEELRPWNNWVFDNGAFHMGMAGYFCCVIAGGQIGGFYCYWDSGLCGVSLVDEQGDLL